MRPSWYHNKSSVTQAGPCFRTNQLDFDDDVIFCARRKLFEIARGNRDRPFCLVVSMTHPHDPFAITEEYWDRYRENEIDPPRVDLPRERQDPHSLRLRHVCDMDRMPVTEHQVRNARRAYYGAISYVDDQVGLLCRTVDDAELAENTVVIILADHGEMLGERGLWFKMNFFEGASRVPLIVKAAKTFAPRRVTQSVSLVDILPTLVELAGNGADPSYASRLDGQSLVPHLQGTGGHDECVGEYLAEGVVAQLVMIRRGKYKFIHCPGDPDQLYDLAADRDELKNLAADPPASRALHAFRDEVTARWDLARLQDAVILSQHRRRLVAAALAAGEEHPWDYQPYRDASRQFVRNRLALDDIEAAARFPRIG